MLALAPSMTLTNRVTPLRTRMHGFRAAWLRCSASIEAGKEIAITRHGRVIARVAPDAQHMAADLFRPFLGEPDIDLEAPVDKLPEPVAPLD